MGNIPVALYRLTATKTKSNYTTPGFTKLASFVTLDATRLTATSEESYIRKVLFLSEVAKKKKKHNYNRFGYSVVRLSMSSKYFISSSVFFDEIDEPIC